VAVCARLHVWHLYEVARALGDHVGLTSFVRMRMCAAPAQTARGRGQSWQLSPFSNESAASERPPTLADTRQ
jgi:hypothetical protein